MRVLILGGTGEARHLAGLASAAGGLDVITSLAGVTASPAPVPGRVRTGGFGGARGLAAFLREERVERVVDATHPFAATITAHALTAGAMTAVPVLVVRRPGWAERPGPQPGDCWQVVPSVQAAAAAVRGWPHGPVLLTVGGRDVAAFADDGSRPYVVRALGPPAGPLPPGHTLVLARGPFDTAGERTLMTGHQIVGLVSRDSGGEQTAAKLHAARNLGLPVLLISRPALPPGVVTVASADDALTWLLQGRSGNPPGARGY